MVDCPADECPFSGPKDSVLGHYSGKRDDAHAGGYEYAKAQLADVDDDLSTDSEPSSSTDNPVMGNSDPSSDSSTDHELPCGHEDIDPNEAPDPPFRVTCDECGGTWKVKSL